MSVATLRQRTLWIGLALCAAPVQAGDVFSWTLAGGPNSTANSGTHGTEFTPHIAITVTKLGFYDDTLTTADALNSPHTVGIFEVATQALLVSVIIPGGTAATRIGDFRFIETEPTPLTAGRAYVVATNQTGDPGRNVTPGSSMIVDGNLTLGPWRTGPQQFGFPSNSLGVPTRFMGAAFCYDPTPPSRPDGSPAWTVVPHTSAILGDGMDGTEFTPNVDIDVLALAYYDDTYQSGDGLNAAHQVGIFDVATQQLRVSAFVPAGTAAPLVSRFRVQPIPAFRLRADTVYVVAGMVNDDPASTFVPGQSMSVSPSLTLGRHRFGSAEFGFPMFVINGSSRAMGPTFLFVPASFQRGDVNCDGALNFLDIDPFLLALFDPAAYDVQFPDCDVLQADIDDNQFVDFFDVDPFIACLFQGCP